MITDMMNQNNSTTFWVISIDSINGKIYRVSVTLLLQRTSHTSPKQGLKTEACFLEMRFVEEVNNAMALDGNIFEGAPVKVRRPSDYNLLLDATLGPSQPNPNLNLGVVGLTPGLDLQTKIAMNGVLVGASSTPWKGVVRFGKRGKLAPRFVGPFEIVERIGPVAYRLRLPQELSCIHDVFHVSNLKKCLAESDIQIPLEEIRVNDKVYFIEEPVEIVDRQIKKLKRSWIPIVKVRWDSRRGAEFTWEREDQFKAKYPHLFMLIHHSSPVEL
ncbi:putative reverse transcriptase domain-containing protein [Tanacetum coccineum]